MTILDTIYDFQAFLRDIFSALKSMGRAVGLIKIILFGLVGALLLSGCTTSNPAVKALKAEAPSAVWDEGSTVQADVTCDGIKDTIVLGGEADAVWIGVVRGVAKGGPKVEPIAASFPIGRQSQVSFCMRPVRIKLYPHDCDGGEYGKLENCKPTKGCKGFSVRSLQLLLA